MLESRKASLSMTSTHIGSAMISHQFSSPRFLLPGASDCETCWKHFHYSDVLPLLINAHVVSKPEAYLSLLLLVKWNIFRFYLFTYLCVSSKTFCLVLPCDEIQTKEGKQNLQKWVVQGENWPVYFSILFLIVFVYHSLKCCNIYC